MNVFDYVKYVGDNRIGPFYTVVHPTREVKERFRIYMLPPNEKVYCFGDLIPKNDSAVLVYGLNETAWNDLFGDEHEWFHEGPWVKEFEQIAKNLKKKIKQEERDANIASNAASLNQKQSIAVKLMKYLTESEDL